MSAPTHPTTWLVTGASRGIGLELARQIASSPDNLLIATCRDPQKATALSELKDGARGKVHVLPLDISDFDGVRASSKAIEAILGDHGLDYLINNAGIVAAWDTAFTLDPEALISSVRTNTAGPAVVSQVCLPFLERGRKKTLIHISSRGGSIGTVPILTGEKLSTYSISKAALNMLAAKQRAEKPELIVICICPGWVKTDMGGDSAALEPSESVAGILKIVTSATAEDSGKYIRYNGEILPW